MQEVYRTIARVASNELAVLVLGESGTGKERVARAIHDFGPRAGAPFVPVDMAAIPRERIESELFGPAWGGGPKPGLLEQARGGTLFLDEIGDMPPEAQTRLVRMLQSGESTPVKAVNSNRADARIIAATHRDLPRLIDDGAFRQDLYYRLNVVPIRLPPLRERAADVIELARHFLERAAADGLPRKTLDSDAGRRLERHDWPGNVRELENMMRRLAALGRDPAIGLALVEQQLAVLHRPPSNAPNPTAALGEALEQHIARHFASYGRELPPDGLYDRALAELERPLLRLALAAVRGNQLKAAKLLGVNRNTLRKKLTERGVGPVVRGSD